uniref:Uncharacterized protein n=1 Tax=viral metagenome TaxID=1070528 RepID=A0A6C0C616_9ZZZZ
MINTTAYGILVFYGLLAIIGAAIGNHFDKKNGFSNGYIAGTTLSLILWFAVGRKMSGV